MTRTERSAALLVALAVLASTALAVTVPTHAWIAPLLLAGVVIMADALARRGSGGPARPVTALVMFGACGAAHWAGRRRYARGDGG